MADLSRLLSTQEWQVFECKRARIRPGDALAPIVAMANAEGGTFVLGLEDPQKAKRRRQEKQVLR